MCARGRHEAVVLCVSVYLCVRLVTVSLTQR